MRITNVIDAQQPVPRLQFALRRERATIVGHSVHLRTRGVTVHFDDTVAVIELNSIYFLDIFIVTFAVTYIIWVSEARERRIAVAVVIDTLNCHLFVRKWQS